MIVTGWMFVWTMLLILVLLVYGFVTVTVAFGGVKDIREMLRQIKNDK